jgi:2-oxoglutarate ferredoxin oxidoreductase subunit gamma
LAIRIVLAGEGGQGVQVIANILAEAAYAEGKEAIYIPNFGVEQRGGVSLAFVQIDDKHIGSPKFPKADIVVALSNRAVDRTRQYVDERTTFVYDNSLVVAAEIDEGAMGIQAVEADPRSQRRTEVIDDSKEKGQVNLPENAANTISIPANDIAKNELHPRVFNIMVLGAVLKATGVVSLKQIKAAIEDKLGSKFEKNPELRDLNYKALEKGMSLVERVV